MQHELLKAAGEYREKLSRTSDAGAFRRLWHETSLPYAMETADPYSEAYKEEVLTVFKELTGQSYSAELEMTSTKQDQAEFELGYPWTSQDLGIISNELAKTVQAIRALHQANIAGPVVELGAGWGNLALPLAKAGFDVTAVDIDPGFVDRLERLAREQHVSIQTLKSSFAAVPHVLNRRFDAVIFQSSFHHCLDFQQLLDGIVTSMLADQGSIFFFSEPIYRSLCFPWGIRYDGEALWAVMCNGWLELGFDEGFFIDLLFRHGLVLSRVPAIDGFVGDGWRATRATNGIRFADLIMSPDYDKGFFPPEVDPAWGRFSRGEGLLPALGMSHCQLTIRNFAPHSLNFSARSGRHVAAAAIAANETIEITIPTVGPVGFSSETYTPSEVLFNGDTRVLGVAITNISWTG